MKKVIWIGSSYKDFMEFPHETRHAVGYALYFVQLGKKHEHVKTLSGMGNAAIAEIKENAPNATYRVIYTIEMEGYVFVLHSFQKKSKSGKATPKQDLEILEGRIKEARALYKEMQKRRKP